MISRVSTGNHGLAENMPVLEKTMQKKEFHLSFFFYGTVGLVLLMLLGFLYILLINTKISNLKVEALLQMGIVLLLLLSPVMFLFWALYRASLTEFTDYEIVQYGLLGKTRIAWDEVTALDIGFLKIKLESKKGKVIILSLPMYKNSDDIVQFIYGKLNIVPGSQE